jgi:hypothetical protein
VLPQLDAFLNNLRTRDLAIYRKRIQSLKGLVVMLLSYTALAGLVAHAASAQLPSAPTTIPQAVGTWSGTSVCLLRNSACKDEIVVYRITQMKSADSVAIDARKIVNGEEEDMGVLSCRFVSATGQLTCVLPLGTWHFTVSKDSLTGELRLSDGTRFREVRTFFIPPQSNVPSRLVEGIVVDSNGKGLSGITRRHEHVGRCESQASFGCAPSNWMGS